MLLWLVIALGFAACLLLCHYSKGITWGETLYLFLASAFLFHSNLDSIYTKATTDHYLVTGQITSLVHHNAYTYNCKDSDNNPKICNQPEGWYIEQRLSATNIHKKITYPIGRDGTEKCFGECTKVSDNSYDRLITVSYDKFKSTKLGDSSVILESYFNPMQASDEVIFDGKKENIPYFEVYNYNLVNRIISPNYTSAQQYKIGLLNASLAKSGISAAIIVVDDNMGYERLKRAWHNGKANDFIVVIYSPDHESIKNVNILGWNNFALKTNVETSIMSLQTVNIDNIIKKLEEKLKQGPEFQVTNFSKYNFLDIKIPQQDYWNIIIYQILFYLYMYLLLHYNPNTKDYKLPWSDAMKMWRIKTSRYEISFSPPHFNWYLHPFTPSGLFLYLFIPMIGTLFFT